MLTLDSKLKVFHFETREPAESVVEFAVLLCLKLQELLRLQLVSLHIFDISHLDFQSLQLSLPLQCNHLSISTVVQLYSSQKLPSVFQAVSSLELLKQKELVEEIKFEELFRLSD